MANNVDERIVETKFDASDFERGVNKTVKKLDELKQSLNLKDSGKSVTEFAEKTSQGMEKASGALEKLENRMTTFKGMIKQQILGGLAQEISGTFLKIERSFSNFVRSLSTGQIASGLNKYTEILNSVRTMTASGVEESAAYEAVKRLGDYSDQTSYSLSQMTSGMSKLVAAGMKLDQAEKSMEGLANMCASAGVNIYEAQRAFLNFSQAYSSGSMRIQDWMSFENLNMATEPVMKIFMQAAEEVGNLTKSIDKNGKEVYKTTNKVNKAIKSGQTVATSGFRDTLSFKWLDKKAMERATAVLSYFEDLNVNLEELTDEDLKSFAAKAFQAAKEARSFADVMGTLKDVIATGWATSFEIVFGKLEEAKKFFTWLTDSNLAKVIYSIGEFRNAVLTAWGVAWDETGEGGLFVEGKTGRDRLLESLYTIDDMIGAIHRSIGNLLPKEWNEVLQKDLSFAERIGKSLGYMSTTVYNTTKKIRDFFAVLEYSEEEGKEVYVLKPEFLSILQKVGHVISTVTVSIKKAFDSVMEPIKNLFGNQDFFSDITHSIDNFLTTIQPIADFLAPVIELLGKIGSIFVDSAIQTFVMNVDLLADAIRFVIELFGGESAQQAYEGEKIIDQWGTSITKFGENCKNSIAAIGDFFKLLFDDLRKLFGLGDKTDVQDGGFFDGIKNFFETNEFIQSIKTWLNELPEKIWKGMQGLGRQVRKIWNVIDEFIFGKRVQATKFDGKQWVGITTRVKSGFSKWLDGVVKSISNLVKSIPQKAQALWNVVDEFLFGQKVTKTVEDPNTGDKKEVTERIKSGFSKWLEDAVNSVRNWIPTIPGRITDLWNKVVEFFFGEEVTTTVKDPDGKETQVKELVKKGFSLWLDNTIEDLKVWIKTIPEKISTLWNGILDVIFGNNRERPFDEALYNNLMIHAGPSVANQYKETWEQENRPIVTAAQQALQGIGHTIGGLFMNLPTYIAEGISNKMDLLSSLLDHVTGWFSDKNEEAAAKETTSAVNGLLDKTAEDAAKEIEGNDAPSPFIVALSDIGQKIATLVTETIPGFLSEGWRFVSTKAAGWWDVAVAIFDEFKGSDSYQQIQQKVTDIGDGIAGFIRSIPDVISMATTWVAGQFVKRNPMSEFSEYFDDDNNIVDPRGFKKALDESGKTIDEITGGSTIWSNISKIGKAIGDAFSDIGPMILDGINKAFEWVGKGFDWVTDFFNNRDKNETLGQSLAKALRKSNGEENTALGEAIDGIGKTIETFITTTIPKFIKAGIEEVKVQLPKLINSLFSGGNENVVTEGAKQSLAETKHIINDFGELGNEVQQTINQNSGWSLLDLFIPRAGAEGESFEGLEAGLNAANEAFAKGNEQLDQTERIYVDREKKLNELKDRLSVVQETLAFAEPWETEKIQDATKEQEKLNKQIAVLENLEGDMVDVGLFDPELYSKGKDAGDRAKDSVDGILGIFKQVGSFMHSDGGMVIAGLGMLALVISQVKDIFSITDEFEAVGDNAKYEAIKIAVLGIVGVLGWVTYLASQTDAHSATGRLQTTLDTLGLLVSLIERIGKVITSIASLKVTNSIFDTIGEFFGFLGSRNDVKAADAKGSFGAGFLGTIFTKLTEFGLIAVGGEAIGKGLRGGLNYLWDSVATLFTDAGIAIDNAISSIVPVVEELASMDAQLDAAIRAAVKTVDLIGKLRDMVEGKGNEIYEGDTDHAVSFVEFQQQYVGKVMETFYHLGAAIHQLATGLSSFGDIETAKKKMTELAGLIASDEFGSFLQNLWNAITTVMIPGSGDSFVTAMGYMTSAMNMLTNGVGDLDSQKLNNINKLFGMLKEFGSNTGESGLNNDRLVNVGNGIQKLGINLKSFIRNVSDIDRLIGTDEAKFTRISQIAELCTSIIGGIAKAVPDLQYIGDGNSISILGEKLPGLGINLSTFITNLNNGIAADIDLNRIQVLSAAITAIAELMKGVGGLMSDYAVPEDIPTFINSFLQGITANFTGENNFFAIGTEAGRNLDLGLAAGIGSGAAILAARQLAGAISGSFRVSWMMHSPSKLFENFGRFANEGLAQGFEKTADKPVNAAEGVSDDVIGAMLNLDPTAPGAQFQQKRIEEQMRETAMSFVADAGVTMRQATEEGLLKSDQKNKNGWLDTALDLYLSREYKIAQQRKTGYGATVITKALAEKLSGIGSELAPNFMQTILDSGMLEGNLNWEKSEYVPKISGMISALLKDVGEHIEDPQFKQASGFITSALDLVTDLSLKDMDITPKITPVVDMSNVEQAAKLLNLFGIGEGGIFSFDTSGLNNNAQTANPEFNRETPTVIDYSGLLSSLRGDLSSLGTQIQNGFGQFGGLQVVLDSGALVGGIIGNVDSRLGRLGFYAGRENS